MGFDEWARKHASNSPGLGTCWTTGDMERSFSGGYDKGYKDGLLAAADIVAESHHTGGNVFEQLAIKIRREANTD